MEEVGRVGSGRCGRRRRPQRPPEQMPPAGISDSGARPYQRHGPCPGAVGLPRLPTTQEHPTTEPDPASRAPTAVLRTRPRRPLTPGSEPGRTRGKGRLQTQAGCRNSNHRYRSPPVRWSLGGRTGRPMRSVTGGASGQLRSSAPPGRTRRHGQTPSRCPYPTTGRPWSVGRAPGPPLGRQRTTIVDRR
jgi:hypothetical protein